jgi:hypothetical protein
METPFVITGIALFIVVVVLAVRFATSETGSFKCRCCKRMTEFDRFEKDSRLAFRASFDSSSDDG